MSLKNEAAEKLYMRIDCEFIKRKKKLRNKESKTRKSRCTSTKRGHEHWKQVISKNEHEFLKNLRKKKKINKYISKARRRHKLFQKMNMTTKAMMSTFPSGSALHDELFFLSIVYYMEF